MPRNISKPFVMTLSLINIEPLTSKYQCFYGEDVQLLVNIIDEFAKPLNLTDLACRVYYINNEVDLRQDDNITITDPLKGKITIIVKRNYIRLGTNEVRIVLYDADQEVHIQPTTILCKETKISDSTPPPEDPTFDYKSEIYAIKGLSNSNATNIGDMSKIQTSYKHDLVGSVNEIVNIVKDTSHLDAIDRNIRELGEDLTATNNSIIATNNRQGDLSLLPTTEKTNLVGSIIEMNDNLLKSPGNSVGNLSLGLKPPSEKWIPLDGSRFHESQYPDLYKYYGSPIENYKFEDYLTIMNSGSSVDSYSAIQYWYDGQMIIPQNVYATTSTFAIFDIENPEMNGSYNLTISKAFYSLNYHRVASKITKVGDYYYTVLGTSDSTSSTVGISLRYPTIFKLQLTGRTFTPVAVLGGGISLDTFSNYYFDKNGNFIAKNSYYGVVSVYPFSEMEKGFAGGYTPVASYSTTFSNGTVNNVMLDSVSGLAYSISTTITFPIIVQVDDLSGNKLDYVLTVSGSPSFSGSLYIKVFPCNNKKLFITVYTGTSSETNKCCYTYYIDHNIRICKMIYSKSGLSSNLAFSTLNTVCMDKFVNLSGNIYMGPNFTEPATTAGKNAIVFELTNNNDIANLSKTDLTFYNDVIGTTVNGISIISSGYITDYTNIHYFNNTIYKQSFGGKTTNSISAFETELTDRKYFKIDTVDKAKTYIRGLK